MAKSTVPAEHDATAHEHPSEFTYIKIAIILAIITVVEVAIYYIEGLRGILVPTLITLSAIKFLFVVAYFMHLKFDDKKLTWTFVFSLITAIAVFIGVWVMQNYNTPDYFL